MAWWSDSPKEYQAYVEERLIADVTELITDALEERGWTQAQLAERLGVQPSEITQRLRGKRNLTLRSLATMLDALGYDIEIRKVDRAIRPVPTSHSEESSRLGEVRRLGPIPSVFVAARQQEVSVQKSSTARLRTQISGVP
jgi:transcriptional regulator with XRE-family HTH domain